MEVSGRIKKLFDVQTFASGFRKRELVVTTQEQYPQDILVEFIQDRIEQLDQFNIGDEVRVSINLKGREWVNPEGVAKYFNSVQGWRIEKTDAVAGGNPSEYADIPPTAPADNYTNDVEDDLPF